MRCTLRTGNAAFFIERPRMEARRFFHARKRDLNGYRYSRTLQCSKRESTSSPIPCKETEVGGSLKGISPVCQDLMTEPLFSDPQATNAPRMVMSGTATEREIKLDRLSRIK